MSRKYLISISEENPVPLEEWHTSSLIGVLVTERNDPSSAITERMRIVRALDNCGLGLRAHDTQQALSREPGFWYIPLPTLWAKELYFTRSLSKGIRDIWIEIDWGPAFSVEQITKKNQVPKKEWCATAYMFDFFGEIDIAGLRKIFLRAGCPEEYLDRYLRLHEDSGKTSLWSGPLPKSWVNRNERERQQFRLFKNFLRIYGSCWNRVFPAEFLGV